MGIGEILILLAWLSALVALGLFVVETRGRRPAGGTTVFAIHAALLVGACGLLGYYFLAHRFEFSYVSQYSSRALSPALTLAALWAGQEGSILLWAAMAGLIGAALLMQPGRLVRPAMIFVSLGQLALVTLLLARSPFARTALIPPDGQGLNPLLEDPWMVVHPPVLFLGYAALLVPFALAAAALLGRDYREWNRMTWPWALFGVVTLGAGIGLGGVWAYKVLGWGGYWGWDPVENASLVPWLVAVALLHGLLIQRTTGALIRTNLILAFLGWVTVVGGTYLTRSGVLQDFSVHSFADSGLNTPLRIILAVFPIIALFLLAPRWASIDRAATSIASVSRESALWLGMVTVLVLAALVTVGTTAPLLTALAGKPAGIQASFYELVSLPIGIALVVLMGLSPALRWFRQSGLSWLAGLWPGVAAAALVVGAALVAGARNPGLLLLIGVAGLALGVNFAIAVRLFRRGWTYGAGYAGHVGIAVMVLGMALSTALGKSQRLELPRGQAVEALGYSLTYQGEAQGTRGDRTLAILIAAPRWKLDARPVLMPSPQGEGMIRKPAIDGWRELYLSPIEVRERHASDAGGTWFDKGQSIDVGGVGYTFRGFKLDAASTFQVRADIEVRKDGRTFTANPAIVADRGGNRSAPADVPGVGVIALQHVDADHGRAALLLPGAAAASVALVDLSTKPFINLVWVGALLAVLGTALAGLRRAAEKTPAERRPKAKAGSRRGAQAPSAASPAAREVASGS